MKHRILIFIGTLCLIVSCKYTPSSPPPSGLDGNWKWNSTVGGIGGFTYTPLSEGFSATVGFSSGSVYSLFRNDTLLRSGTYTVTTSNGVSHISLPQASDSLFHYKIIFSGKMTLSSDSLLIWQDSISDGFSTLFIRK